MPASIIDQIKERTDLCALITQSYTLTGREGARTRSTVEHDSLIIWPATQTWRWFAQGVGGDCLDWVCHTQNLPLAAAIEILAQAANIERRPLTPVEEEDRLQKQRHQRILRLAADHYHATLISHPAAAPARAYCATRGWTDATITAEMIGCTLPLSGDNMALSAEPLPSPIVGEGVGVWVPLSAQLRAADLLSHPTARAVLSIPPDMLVYIHRDGGHITYLSARSITGKRHYNLPAELVGDRQPYPNALTARPNPYPSLLVEGQADAISLAQLGIPAVALAGVDGNLTALPPITHLAFDADESGHKRALAVTAALDPMLPIVEWQPIAGKKCKDANDVLRAGANADTIDEIIAQAKPALLHHAAATRRLSGDLRTEAQRKLLDAYFTLDELVQADIKPRLADALGIGIAHLNRMIKAREKEREATGEDADDEKNSPQRYIHSAGGNEAGHIWEMCIGSQPDGRKYSYFAVRKPNGEITTQASVDIGNTTYLPHPHDIGIIQARVVHFPSAPIAYGSQPELIRTITAFIHDYLDVDPFYERLAAYYVMFSWLYDLFENLPYLRALGDYGTGKTRFLQTIGVLCYRPMFVSGASSVSPIFRLIDLFRGTLIIDEADFSNSDAEAEIIKIMNVGYYNDGIVLRSEKDPASNAEEWMPMAYRVFGPKILATRRPFADRATESRCLTKRMTTARPRPNIPYILNKDFWDQACAIRNQLLQYRLEHWHPVTVDHSLADESVEPRLNQITMALKTIVDPEMRGEIDTFIRAYNDTLISDRQMSIPALVVQALADIHYSTKRTLLDEDARDFSMKGISDKVAELLMELDPDTRVSPKKIGSLLSEDLGLSRRTVCPRTRRSRLDYTDDELAALMRRYGIDAPEKP